MNVVHTTEVRRTASLEYLAYCVGCGWRSNQQEDRLVANDEGAKHAMEAKVGLLYRGPRKPALKSMVAYYEEQALKTSYTTRERLLWQQLADELRRTLPKLKHDPEDPNQIALFDLQEGARS